MNQEILEKTKKILKENLYMTISVADKKGGPWIANLYYAYDKDYNFYWYSPKNSIHSKLIRENPHIAIAVFDSTAIGDDVDAVYIKAKAYEIGDKKELVKGCLYYAKKLLATKFIGKKADIQRFVKQYKDFQGMSVLRMYKGVPEKFWKLAPSEVFNDKFVDSRLEVDLKNNENQ